MGNIVRQHKRRRVRLKQWEHGNIVRQAEVEGMGTHSETAQKTAYINFISQTSTVRHLKKQQQRAAGARID